MGDTFPKNFVIFPNIDLILFAEEVHLPTTMHSPSTSSKHPLFYIFTDSCLNSRNYITSLFLPQRFQRFSRRVFFFHLCFTPTAQESFIVISLGSVPIEIRIRQNFNRLWITFTAHSTIIFFFHCISLFNILPDRQQNFKTVLQAHNLPGT